VLFACDGPCSYPWSTCAWSVSFVQVFQAAAEHIVLAPGGAWAAVSTPAGTLHHVDTATLAVAAPALAIHSPGNSAVTSVSVVRDSDILMSDSSGMLTFVRLQPSGSRSQIAPTTLSAFASGCKPNMAGPGGQPNVISGVVQLGLIAGQHTCRTGADAAGSMAECAAHEARQVGCVVEHDKVIAPAGPMMRTCDVLQLLMPVQQHA
jgi:hypothetical protein